jgi:hypothetical protein
VHRDERFDWEGLVPLVVHPVKVAIIEAIEWIDRPLSASELTKIIGDPKFGLSHVAYHLKSLGEIGVLKVVSRQKVRGSVEKFFSFDESHRRGPAGDPLHE